ncbi:hypothetical protein ACLIYP_05570 [Streptomyces nanhaiensis]|uniref:hypothetical protein n=1 Tax=Streptomyces nanhaiensis TaxID=679319 RepID=UPI00399C878E
MRHPFKHPLATHHALEVLGWRRNGAPIYAIAGGNGEGDGGTGSTAGDGGDGSGTSGQDGTGSGTSGGPAGAEGSGQGGDGSGTSGNDGGEPDWKALARQWEKRAKENKGAAAELEKLREQQMTEQERAVKEAEKAGRTAAAAEYGRRLAEAEFRAATAAAGVDLGDAAEFIDVGRFVGDDGEVNTAAIKSAVTRFAKLAGPRGPGRSGGDMGGGAGDGAPSLAQQIADAKSKGDWRTVMRLENSKLAAAEQQQ